MTTTIASNQKKTTTATTSQLKTLAGFSTKSAKIRFLNSEGYTKGDIARIMGIRYQHVNNVLNQKVTTPKETHIVAKK